MNEDLGEKVAIYRESLRVLELVSDITVVVFVCHLFLLHENLYISSGVN